jgi:RNA polymerase sigma-70 factor (ECF subfamily)
LNNLFSLLNLSGRRRLETMRPRLYRLAFAWCHDASLADDLAQETLAKALARGDQLRDEQALESWLFSVLNNVWRDHLRARREFLDVYELDEAIYSEDAGPEERYASRQASQRVRRAIAALPLGQRQAITLVDIEELPYARVAEILGIPVGTVMSRLARGRLALRSHLENPESEHGRAVPRADTSYLRRVK